MSSTVPTLSELLNLKPGSRYPIGDTNITVRCPKSDCFSLQSLADAEVIRGMFETRYTCQTCETTVAMVRPVTAPPPALTKGETVGVWTAWVPATGINLRLANTKRLRS